MEKRHGDREYGVAKRACRDDASRRPKAKPMIFKSFDQTICFFEKIGSDNWGELRRICRKTNKTRET